ncbi:hypothetical protein FRB94_009148 [Tulasnella sp. JGI-2019a]|nr:hypothetical protein FRB94_009148 [Tulasnella sp. JGI-2019a]KAG9029368.1 hypothetical protein FRB95_005375 [Tulasnella sp. JGI-2019a]
MLKPQHAAVLTLVSNRKGIESTQSVESIYSLLISSTHSNNPHSLQRSSQLSLIPILAMPSSNIRKYLHLIVLALAVVFAAIELWLTLQLRNDLDSFNPQSTYHRLDLLIACSGWTIGCSILLILLSLAAGAEKRGVQMVFVVYFVITAIAWLVGATLWHYEVKNRGCDMGHDQCHHNDRIQGIAWAELLKHVLGTLTFGWKLTRGNKESPVDNGYNGQKGMAYGGNDEEKEAV